MRGLPRCRVALGIGLCVALTLPAGAAEPPPGRNGGRMVIEPLSRREFAARMAKVTKGMSEWEVRKRLGKPDDVRTCRELHGTTTGTREIWCYGTDGHLTFPTLGCVYIDTAGEAQYVFGGRGNPPDPTLVREEPLRNLLRLIDEAPTVSGHRYNPRTITRIVNRLQPLGKDRALAVIDEYLRVASTWHSDAREGLFLVLRVLFDVPADPGYMPRMHIGAPTPWAEPKDPKVIPRFPILLIDDIPLLVVSGYNLGGFPEQVESHVEYFRKHGCLRAAPLVPADRPLGVLDHLPDAVAKHFGDPKWADYWHDMLRDQLFRLIYSVYRKKGLAIEDEGISYDGYWLRDGPSWKHAQAAVDDFNIRWDARRVTYTFRDGSTLPPPPRYARFTWEIKEFDTTATLIIERQDDEVVNIGLSEPIINGPPVPQPALRVYPVKDKKQTLIEFAKVGLRGDAFGGQWRGRNGLKLPLGQSIQAELTLGKKSVRSPVYEP